MRRCLLLANGEGDICGVKLGPGRGDDEHLVVSEVLSESVEEVCQVAEGDVVTHIDGHPVFGGRKHKAWNALLHRRRCRSLTHRQGQPQAQQSSVVEVRLIRARSLKKRSQLPPARPASTLALPHTPVFYYETHARDTLASVAAFFQTTPQDIRHDNRDFFRVGEKAGTLHPGLLLKIRNPDYYALEEEEEKAISLSAALLSSSSSRSTSIHGTSNIVSSPTTSTLSRLYHQVQDGENVERIARQHSVALMDLRKWNRRLFPTGEVVRVLPAGTRLLLFVERKEEKKRECTRPIAIQPNQEEEEGEEEPRQSKSISPE